MRRILGIALVGLVGCGGGEPSPPTAAGDATAPDSGPATAPALAPPVGAASAATAAEFPELPNGVNLLRVTQGGWRMRRDGQNVWQRGLSAQARLRLPHPALKLLLRLPTGRAITAELEEVRGEEEQILDAAWGLDDADWASVQKQRRVDLAVRFDYSALAAHIKKHANVRQLEISTETQRVPVGQGQELELTWRDLEDGRALSFRVDHPDATRPAVLFLVEYGLGSKERALAEALSVSDPFELGSATDVRAIFVEFPKGWSRCRGEPALPATDATVHELGWVIPKPHTDPTKPIPAKLAVISLPVVILRDVPVGW